MSKKAAILKKIDCLILVTEENLAKLKSQVKKLENDQDLEKIEKLIDEEDALVEESFRAVFEAQIKAGNPDFLSNLERAFKKAQKGIAAASGVEEQAEKGSDNSQAEVLLQHF